MQNIQPLDLLLDQRKEHWLMHCRFVLEQLLVPICSAGLVKTTTPLQRAIVLIENRVDKQWLFTVLNTWLMCPKDSEFVLITDKGSVAQAKDILNGFAPSLKAIILMSIRSFPAVAMADYQFDRKQQWRRSASTGESAANQKEAEDVFFSRH